MLHCEISDSLLSFPGRKLKSSSAHNDHRPRWLRAQDSRLQTLEAIMGSQHSRPNWSDPKLLSALTRAFEATWPVIRAEECDGDKPRIAELSMELSRKLVELAANGVTDAEELGRLALENFPLKVA